LICDVVSRRRNRLAGRKNGSYRVEFKLLSLGAFYRVSLNLPAAISVYVADTID
jgi:hypothetical protein